MANNVKYQYTVPTSVPQIQNQHFGRVYPGPARVTKHIGTRSVQLEMEEVNGRNITYKRDIGMLLLKKPRMADVDPTIPQRDVIGTQIHAKYFYCKFVCGWV